MMRRIALVLLALMPGLGTLRCADAAKAPKWYEAEYEYNYSEMLVLMVLVVLAICFETAWHHIAHKSEHSYKFGRIEHFVNAHHQLPFGKANNQQLFRDLVTRAGGEFMTLGFLAACVYFFRQAGGFDWLGELSQKDVWPYPKSGYDWLHLAEDVHFKLFIAMVFYFILTARVVSGAVYRIRLWEHARLKRILPNFDDMPMVEHIKVSDAVVAEHASLRRYFIAKMVGWQQKRPKIFRQLVHELQLDARDQEFDQKFCEVLDNDFSFSAYLAVSIESGVRDSIQVHVSTWCVLLLLLGLFAVLHRVNEMNILEIMPVLVVLAVLVIIAMRLVVRRTRGQIADRMGPRAMGTRRSSSSIDMVRTTTSVVGPDTGACHCIRRFRRWLREAHRTEFLMLRFLQAVLFLISYLFSRLLLDFHDWRNNADRSLLYSALFFVLFLALAFEVPRSVPEFLGITSLPPYMDREQFRLFGAVLLQGREAHYQREVQDLKAKLLHGGTGDLSQDGDDGDEETGDIRTPLAVLSDQLEQTMTRDVSHESGDSQKAPKAKRTATGNRLVDQDGEFFRTFIALARQRGLDNDEVARGIGLHLRRPMPADNADLEQGQPATRPGSHRPSSERPSPHAGDDDAGEGDSGAETSETSSTSMGNDARRTADADVTSVVKTE